MKIVLIDHNDSFTYNIIELLRKFKNVDVQVINYQIIDLKKITEFDKIILSPGPGLPTDYPKTNALIEQFYRKKPIFGICLGHQMLSEFFGLKMYNLAEVKHGVSEQIIVDDKSLLYRNISNEIRVGLYHSWAVKQVNNNRNIQITAWNKDQVIMSIEHKKLPIFGTQYHVESFLTPMGEKIMKNFIFNA